MIAEGLRDALTLVGRPLSTFESVLDLGCGCGRVLRWFQEEARTTRFHGSDISGSAIEWNRRHMPFARFDVNGKEPPLAHPDGSFDLVIAVSVVTHLSEELQLAWLAELKRVLRPGGLLLMTVLGDDSSEQRLTGRDLEAYRAKGQDAFHSRAYVERVWSRFLPLRAYLRNGPMYVQDLVVLEKPVESGGGNVPYVRLDMPLCNVGAPPLGSVIEGKALPIFGTAFFPKGGAVNIDVRVDGRSIGILPAAVESPAVGDAFPAWPSAARSTFEGRLPLGPVRSGPHALALYAGAADTVALASSYFFTP
jgi:SAM-dependent methyltransferase